MQILVMNYHALVLWIFDWTRLLTTFIRFKNRMIIFYTDKTTFVDEFTPSKTRTTFSHSINHQVTCGKIFQGNIVSDHHSCQFCWKENLFSRLIQSIVENRSLPSDDKKFVLVSLIRNLPVFTAASLLPIDSFCSFFTVAAFHWFSSVIVWENLNWINT